MYLRPLLPLGMCLLSGLEAGGMHGSRLQAKPGGSSVQAVGLADPNGPLQLRSVVLSAGRW
jgi:hypothetical protein